MPNEQDRAAAIGRLKARSDFKTHVGVYVVVNTMLVVIWALSGTGYFWPIWPMLGWGAGLAMTAWTVYVKKPITEDDIRADMRRNEPRRLTD